MANIAQDKRLAEDNKDSHSLFTDQLSNFTIVDMGEIVEVKNTVMGYRAVVRTTRVYYEDVISYDNVEIIMPGNKTTGIHIDPIGAACIIFGPLSTSYSVEKQAMIGPWRPYDRTYLKCMPIYNPSLWTSSIFFSTEGSISFNMAGGVLSVSRSGDIRLRYNDIDYDIAIGTNGVITVQTPTYYQQKMPTGEYFLFHYKEAEPSDKWRSEYDISYFESFREGVYFEAHTNVEPFQHEDSEETMWDQLLAFDNWRYTKEWKEDTKTVIRKDTDGKSLYTSVMNPDGSNTITQTNADGEPLFFREINADGEYTLIIGDDMYKLNIDKDGNRTESFEGDHEHSITGNVTTTINGDEGRTIDGAYSIAVGGDTTVESTGKMKLYSDAKLIIATGAASLFEILDTLWSDLKGASPATMGSPAAHSWNPAIPIAFTQAATKLAQLVEDP